MKISNLVEQIFAHAVALDQNGGLRNTIYASNNEIYILNYDHTVLMRFRLRKSEANFDHPISFKANDYDSNEFEEIEGKVIFISTNDSYSRKKTCGTSDLTVEQVKKLYLSYSQETNSRQTIILNKEVLELLDSNLSHIEFIGKKGESMKMIQRNIYSGGVIEVQKKNKGGLFPNLLTSDFGPVAMKTNDFNALFTFEDTLSFSFPTKGKEDYVLIKNVNENKRNMKAIIACCLYDEIIKIKEAKNYGGKK